MAALLALYSQPRNYIQNPNHGMLQHWKKITGQEIYPVLEISLILGV